MFSTNSAKFYNNFAYIIGCGGFQSLVHVVFEYPLLESMTNLFGCSFLIIGPIVALFSIVRGRFTFGFSTINNKSKLREENNLEVASGPIHKSCNQGGWVGGLGSQNDYTTT